MRKILSLLVLIVSVFTFNGCKNDLNILAAYKDIPVVYGLMDQNDTAHYIRVNKAYLGPGNAITMGANYDSINYPTGTISVVLLDYDVNGNPIGKYTLTPDSSIPVAPGMFSYPKEVLYKTKRTLNPNDTYNLLITNLKTGKTVTGSTTLLQDVTFTSGAIIFASSFQPADDGFTTNIQWNTNNAAIYQFVIRFYYTEKNISAGTTTPKSVDWVFGAQTNPNGAGSQLEVQYDLDGFIAFLHGSLVASPNYTRTADSAHIMLTMGSTDLNTYIELSQPSLGIDQNVPSYTDVTGGIGIYTARHVMSFSEVGVSARTLDSIRINPLTQPLNF